MIYLSNPELIWSRALKRMAGHFVAEVPDEALTSSPPKGVMAEAPISNDWPLGGRLKHFKEEWDSASRWQRNVINRGLRWKFAKPPPPSPMLQPCPQREYPHGTEEQLARLHKEGVIVECRHP